MQMMLDVVEFELRSRKDYYFTNDLYNIFANWHKVAAKLIIITHLPELIISLCPIPGYGPV